MAGAQPAQVAAVRVLHVGYGYTPLRSGGLIEYAEDLMAAQVRQGDHVGFFTAGRRYPWFRKPRLWRWHRDGVEMFELINSPLPIDEYKSVDPHLDLEEPQTTALLVDTIRTFRPDVIHVQELCSLPSSVLDVIRRSGVPHLMTLQDYLPLCPTFRLFDYTGSVCLVREVGGKCVPCTEFFSGNPRHLHALTARYEIERWVPRTVRSGVRLVRPVLRPLRRSARWLRSSIRASRRSRPPAPRSDSRAVVFQQRRDVNTARLNAVDLLVAQSRRVEAIYRDLGVDPHKIRTVHMTVNHLEQVRFREQLSPPDRVTFVTLNGCATVEKGARVIIEAVEQLARDGANFRLLVYGNVHPDARQLLTGGNIELRGPYQLAQLDHLLDDANVGIMPSIWEEAYGYAGIEMLAKGLPVIGNNIGGITDYVKPGKTGWINESNTGAGLAQIMREIIDRPHVIAELNAVIRDTRNEIVKAMDTHVREMAALYGEVRNRGMRAAVPSAAGC